jgi:16S rRNA (uracil1498-N3)-methyltransferase
MAALPHFFHDAILKQGDTVWLDEATARHTMQVLRMQAGEPLQLIDGRGNAATATITTAEKKKCAVFIDNVVFHQPYAHALHLGIAFTKNSSRNEWLLEKATELGVSSIIPLITTRTEREKVKHDRWRAILISALLQSQQYHLPKLGEPTQLPDVIKQYAAAPQKLIAHCIDEHKRSPVAELLKPGVETLLLIGPEGDFTVQEVTLCEARAYKGISLGTQRLRTETAAMAVCAYFNLINHD